MAVTNFSPLLGLALPTTGDLQGTWGTTVNTAITGLIDSAVAGTTTLSANADVTLTTTNGAANQARNAVILWTANNGLTTRTITAPAQSKAYMVINAGTGSIIVKGSGTISPYVGVTISSNTTALIAWNGSDFVTISSSSGGASGAGGAIVINNTTVNTNYTIASGTNGFSVGPMTVSSGYAVTVSSGQRWVVI
jgi:hypothetical protein